MYIYNTYHHLTCAQTFGSNPEHMVAFPMPKPWSPLVTACQPSTHSWVSFDVVWRCLNACSCSSIIFQSTRAALTQESVGTQCGTLTMLDTVPTHLADLGLFSSFLMSNPGRNLERLEKLTKKPTGSVRNWLGWLGWVFKRFRLETLPSHKSTPTARRRFFFQGAASSSMGLSHITWVLIYGTFVNIKSWRLHLFTPHVWIWCFDPRISSAGRGHDFDDSFSPKEEEEVSKHANCICSNNTQDYMEVNFQGLIWCTNE